MKLLKYASVITPRLEQLLQLRAVVRNNAVFNFFKFIPDLYKSSCKSLEDTNISLSDVINAFRYLKDPEFREILVYLQPFFSSKADAVIFRAFTVWVSRLPVILERDWKMHWQAAKRFIDVHVCKKRCVLVVE